MGNLISIPRLRASLDDPDLRLVDVRFDLADPEAGRRAYREGHLPGAVYLHLDEDLSSPVAADGRGGRHPLPDPSALAARLGEVGIGDEHRVVVYDDATGMVAARAWWVLRWLRHDRVQVLDGGVRGWTDAGGRLVTEEPTYPPARHGADADASMVADRDEVMRSLEDPSTLLVDARAAERYRGEHEPIDPRAGHVPGAVNLPFAGNLRDGRMLPPEALRRRFAETSEAERVVVYCGSGVSAAHDALAMEEAGLPLPVLYAGSWSDWTAHDDAPIETGDRGSSTPEDGGGGST